MADQVINIQLTVDGGGQLTKATTDVNKLTGAVDKNTSGKKKNAKANEEVIKGQKGIHQSNLSTAKGFSKMNQMLGSGGSSGLVAAYATLAANVFAATAAFNALRQAAQVQTLIDGFTKLAAQSGRTATIVAENMREITGGGLSMEQALRASALALSSGFSTSQLNELTEVAKNASIALGRNLADSTDRLIRGVAKLEPEILDELGIMVRLDTAVEKYAAALGKSATSLTDFERRQAFLNESITQGQAKFGQIGDSVPISPFEKLGATFGDLTDNIFRFITNAFGPLIEVLANSQTALLGLMIMFGSTILGAMLPALKEMTGAQLERTKGLLLNAKAAQRNAEIEMEAAKASAKFADKSVGISKLQTHIKKGTDTLRVYDATLKKLHQRERLRQKNLDEGAVKNRARAQKELADLRAQIAETERLRNARMEAEGAGIETGAATRKAMGAQETSRGNVMIMGAGGLGGFKEATKATSRYSKRLKVLDRQQGKIIGKGAQRAYTTAGAAIGAAFRIAGMGAKFFGVALINAIPLIGQIIFGVSILIDVLVRFLGTSAKIKAAQEQLDEVLGGVKDKFDEAQEASEAYRRSFEVNAQAVNESAVAGKLFADTLRIQSGIADEFVTALNKLNKATADEGGKVTASFFRIIGDGLSFAFNKLVEFAGAIGRFIRNIPGIKQLADGFELIGEKIKTAATVDQLITNYETAFAGLAGESKETAELLTQEIGNALGNLAESENLDARWAGVLAIAGDDLPTAYREAAKAGFEVAEIQAVLGGVLNSASVAILGQSNTVNKLSDGYADLDKNLNKFFAKTAKKNEFRELADQFQGLQQQLAKTEEIAGEDNFENFIAFLDDKTQGVIKKMIDFKDEAGNFIFAGSQMEERTMSLADAFIKLANDEEEYADKKAALQYTQKATKAMTDLAVATADYNAKLKNLQKSGTFSVSPGDEVKLAREQAAIRLAALQAETNQKLILHKMEFDILDLKLKLNAKLYDEETGQLSDLGKRLQDLYNIGRTAGAQAIQDAADTTAMAYSDVLARSGAGTKGSLLDRIRSGGELTAQVMGEDGEMTTKELPGILSKDSQATFQERITFMRNTLAPLREDLMKLGPEGELAAALQEGSLIMVSAFDNISDGTLDMADKLSAVAGVIQAMASIMAASSKRNIQNIENQINAEKRRDGQSKASLAKIKAMENKKEAMARKAFEQNKKMQIASAIASTAAAVAGVLGNEGKKVGILAMVLAGIVGAMGLAQVAIIKKQKYEGGSSGGGASVPQAISVGSRSNAIDVSRGATGGELSYLRGERGMGTAQNFTPGAAAGIRNYAAGGIVVGEQGPEVVTPTTTVDVVPNDRIGGNTSNVNFTINAVDAAGVQQVLEGQRGHIIGMIREAAHEHGEDFIESVNTDSYGGGG